MAAKLRTVYIPVICVWPVFETVSWQRAEHAQQELGMIRAEPFLGTKHMYRKKRLCLQGAESTVTVVEAVRSHINAMSVC